MWRSFAVKSTEGGRRLRVEEKKKTSRAFYKTSRTTVPGGLIKPCTCSIACMYIRSLHLQQWPRVRVPTNTSVLYAGRRGRRLALVGSVQPSSCAGRLDVRISLQVRLSVLFRLHSVLDSSCRRAVLSTKWWLIRRRLPILSVPSWRLTWRRSIESYAASQHISDRHSHHFLLIWYSKFCSS